MKDDSPAAAEDRVLRALVLASLAIPLVVLPHWFLFPHVAPKVFLLRILATAAAALLAGSVVLGRKRLARPGLVAGSGVAFLASAALSTAFGVDPARGLWDGGERMLGLVTYGAMAAWFLVAVNSAREDVHWRSILRATLVASTLVVLVGVAERAGFLPQTGDGRVASTLGHPSYVGALSLHLVFGGVLLRGMRASRTDDALALLGFVAGIVALVLSETRAAVVGLAFGAAAALVLLASLRGTRLRRTAVALMALAAVGAAALFAARDSAFVQDIPIARRLVAATHGDATVSTRFIAWDAALDAARERPLLGWGPNAYSHAFGANYRPGILRYGFAETRFDDAHGIVFNTLAEQGLLGLAAMAALYAAAVVVLRRAANSGRVGATAAVAAAGWLAAHLGYLCFSFEDASSLLHFVLVLAFVEHVSSPRAGAPAVPAAAGRLRVAAAVGCVALGAGAIAWIDVRPAVANVRARGALGKIAREPFLAVERMQASRDVSSPHADTNAVAFAALALDRIPALVTSGRVQEADALGRCSFDALMTDAERSASRRDPLTATLRAALAESTPCLASDPAVSASVRDDLLAAQRDAPRRQDLRFALAALEARLGRTAEAATILRAAVADDPAGSSGWVRLAALYRAAGHEDDARRIVQEARDRGVGFTAEEEALLRQRR